MRNSETILQDTNLQRRPETTKESSKRKALDASPAGEDSKEDNDQGRHLIRPQVSKGRIDEEDDLTGSQSEPRSGSEVMEISIKNIREKMDIFTQQVSTLLEAGKTFFLEATTAFEERIVDLHQKQIENWEQEIGLLRSMDNINEDMSLRLADARATISLLHPGVPDF